MVCKIARRIDQCEMGKCLWEIADQSARARLILFAQQAKVIAQRKQMIKQPQRIIPAAQHEIGVSKPETAGEEHALAGWQAVARPGAIVAEHQTIHHKPTLDRFNGSDDTGVVGW